MKNHSDELIFQSQGSRRSAANLEDHIGEIGGRYAKKMKALDAYVIGFRKTDKEKPEYVDEQYTLDKLPEMIGRADRRSRA